MLWSDGFLADSFSMQEHDMYLMRLHDGQQCISKGRVSSGCIYVKLEGTRFWRWIPREFIAKAIDVSHRGHRAA